MREIEKKILVLVADRLKTARIEQNISHRKLSAITGVDTGQIVEIESGKVNFKLLTIFKLAAGLRIPVTDLLDFINPLEFE